MSRIQLIYKSFSPMLEWQVVMRILLLIAVVFAFLSSSASSALAENEFDVWPAVEETVQSPDKRDIEQGQDLPSNDNNGEDSDEDFSRMLSIARLIKRNSGSNQDSEPVPKTKKVTLKELLDTRGLSISRLIKRRALDIRSDLASSWKTRVGKRSSGGCNPEITKTRLFRRDDVWKPDFTALWKTRLGKRGCDDEEVVDRTPDLTDFHSTRELWKTRLYKRNQEDTLTPDFTALWKTRLGKKRQNVRLPGFYALWKTRLG